MPDAIPPALFSLVNCRHSSKQQTIKMKGEDEKLVLLVQDREALYNNKLKDHHNRNLIENLWKEVGEEMKMTVNDCKQKWTNLRNSYARHLRNQNKPSGSESEQKPKWYLAEVMSFLKDFVQHRKLKGDSEKEEGEEGNLQPTSEDSQTISNENINVVEESFGKKSASGSKQISRPKKRQLTSELLAGPMIDFLKINTHNNIVEHPLLSYVKGMLPDYDALTPKRQRIFKQKIVTILNDLMDDQETNEQSSSTPAPSTLKETSGIHK